MTLKLIVRPFDREAEETVGHQLPRHDFGKLINWENH